jgi:hypothetical protein
VLTATVVAVAAVATVAVDATLGVGLAALSFPRADISYLSGLFSYSVIEDG